jgi:hypothetical protein
VEATYADYIILCYDFVTKLIKLLDHRTVDHHSHWPSL